jgi:hypothetical protein
MSVDCYFSEEGDLALSSDGDIALVQDAWRSHSQQAYIRLKTSIGDYLLFPDMGADLERLIGEPQSEKTGRLGEYLIERALTRDGVLSGYPMTVKAVPMSLQSIRFDIYITVGNRAELVLSVNQDLGSEDFANELEA